MRESLPSATAQRVALRRAAHQIFDRPQVLVDDVALRIVGREAASALQGDGSRREATPMSRALRAFMAARSRFAEDELERGVRRGITQYVILGAGLDTFAYRSPYPGDALHVFEVDHPATQAWKRQRLDEAAIPIPDNLTFVALDFEHQPLQEGLDLAGCSLDRMTFFSWLGVTVYLTRDAVLATLRHIASYPPGSGVVFDYGLAPADFNPLQRLAFDALAQRVAAAGEPWQTFFAPVDLAQQLQAMGFAEVEDLGPDETNARYFRERTDGLRVGSLAHLMSATVGQPKP